MRATAADLHLDGVGLGVGLDLAVAHASLRVQRDLLRIMNMNIKGMSLPSASMAFESYTASDSKKSAPVSGRRRSSCIHCKCQQVYKSEGKRILISKTQIE